MPTSDTTTYNSGDIIQVRCNVIDWTGPQKLIRAMLSLSQPKFDETFAKRVR